MFARVRPRGFPALLGALFLGALNDNLCRITVSLFAAAAATAEGGGLYLALSGALFTLPYLLFSGYAGHLADAFDKRRILILTKVGEIGAMVLALLAFRSGHIEAMLGVLFLLGLLAAFFSPSRYGLMPEILADRDLSRGNALGEMSSFLAIILGTALGSAAYDRWQADLTPIVLIGQAPGPREGGLGRPFAWTAGKTMFKWFEDAMGASEEQMTPAYTSRPFQDGMMPACT